MVEQDYISYLLRLWRAVRGGRPGWQASLECIHTGEQQTFSLEGLLAYLQSRYGPAEQDHRGSTETGPNSTRGQSGTR